MQVLKDDVRENIYSSAMEEFFAKGYRGASMRDISKRAGVSLSNTYNYFENKERLFYEIVSPVRAVVMDIMNEALYPGAAGTAFEEFTGNLTEKIACLSGQRRKAIIILMEKSEGTEFESLQKELAEILAAHFTAELGEDDGCAYGIIASNFISGLLGIIKAGEYTGASLKRYLTYHINGVLSMKRT